MRAYLEPIVEARNISVLDQMRQALAFSGTHLAAGGNSLSAANQSLNRWESAVQLPSRDTKFDSIIEPSKIRYCISLHRKDRERLESAAIQEHHPLISYYAGESWGST